jgi:hypothetical protein
MSEKLRQVLQTMSQDSELLQQLRENPQEVVDRFELSPAESQRLEHSDRLFSLVNNPFVESNNTITLHTITITSSPPVAAPCSLEELSQERLVEITQRILMDAEYAARVRAFLGL